MKKHFRWVATFYEQDLVVAGPEYVKIIPESVSNQFMNVLKMSKLGDELKLYIRRPSDWVPFAFDTLKLNLFTCFGQYLETWVATGTVQRGVVYDLWEGDPEPIHPWEIKMGYLGLSYSNKEQIAEPFEGVTGDYLFLTENLASSKTRRYS